MGGVELSHFGQIFLIILSSLIGLYILYHYMAIDQGAELGLMKEILVLFPLGYGGFWCVWFLFLLHLFF